MSKFCPLKTGKYMDHVRESEQNNIIQNFSTFVIDTQLKINTTFVFREEMNICNQNT